MAQRVLNDLSTADCFELLHRAEVGRLVYVDDEGPAAIPVNYAIDGESLVVRIEHSPKTEWLSGPLAFQVDDVDPEAHTGWSVLVRGRAEALSPEEVPAVLGRIGRTFPRPWAAGVHNIWLSIEPTRMTGKRFGRRVE